jgi:hypothetical protein
VKPPSINASMSVAFASLDANFARDLPTRGSSSQPQMAPQQELKVRIYSGNKKKARVLCVYHNHPHTHHIYTVP